MYKKLRQLLFSLVFSRWLLHGVPGAHAQWDALRAEEDVCE